MSSVENYTLRRVFKSALTGPAVIQELMQLMFLAELLNPSDDVWIVSPWIGNVEVLDNQAGNFDVINPEWRRRKIRLIDLGLQILSGGSKLILVTRPDEDRNETFLEQLLEQADVASLSDGIEIIRRENLHTKGILTGSGLLLGSMNLTYTGLEINDEVVEYDTSNQRRAEARQSFESYMRDSI